MSATCPYLIPLKLRARVNVRNPDKPDRSREHYGFVVVDGNDVRLNITGLRPDLLPFHCICHDNRAGGRPAGQLHRIVSGIHRVGTLVDPLSSCNLLVYSLCNSAR